MYELRSELKSGEGGEEEELKCTENERGNSINRRSKNAGAVDGLDVVLLLLVGVNDVHLELPVLTARVQELLREIFISVGINLSFCLMGCKHLFLMQDMGGGNPPQFLLAGLLISSSSDDDREDVGESVKSVEEEGLC